ncbi:MAG: MBL fold metallo-hydrolase [Firmicutes bacterium]|jgi:competence protein ComEC|nr:MBL fold metallo-hydrolase [Bacillota bacterium]MDD4337218.1 MBL fold metallo-hydrolase [Bacillota bacterium]MDD4792161.1 MBL fold metallo-hydrolase [Bacillota bacterium]
MANSRILNTKRLLGAAAIVILCVLVGSAILSFRSSANSEALTVTFIDVGQGDAILVSTEDGHHMLVDGGPRAAGAKLVATLDRLGVTRLDVIVSTHPHEDHIGGLLAVLDFLEVDRVADSAWAHTTATYESYLTKIYDKGIPFFGPRAGDSFGLGNASVRVLWPTEPPASNINDRSLVLEVACGESRVLLTGDISGYVERTLAGEGVLSKIDLMKVAHHGSRSSTTQTFLASTSPDIAVIPVGAGNDYGHPSSQALANLRARDVLVYRTDEHGHVTVTLQSDRRTWSVSIEKPGDDLRAACGSRVFHRKTCQHARRITPAKTIVICDREQALNAGYRPCKVCNP